MTTFPDVSSTFPGGHLEWSTFPDWVPNSLKGSGNLETSAREPISSHASSTFPDGRPIQTRLHGGAAPRLEGIVQRAETWNAR